MIDPIERLRRANDELRTVALDLGSEYSELINCVGIVNAVKQRIQRERVQAGLRELAGAEAMDLRLRTALVEAP